MATAVSETPALAQTSISPLPGVCGKLGMPKTGFRRDAIHSSKLATVENVLVSPTGLPPSGYETHFQIVLPYSGLFAYGVGRKKWLFDSNRMLFVSPSREFTDVHPVEEVGHAALIINPSTEMLGEICRGAGPERDPAFLETSRPTTSRLQLLRHQLLRFGSETGDPLLRDEWTVRLLQEAIALPHHPSRARAATVSRAKEVIHARSHERLSLTDIAEDVGVTAVYLTQEFTRSEGMPLYRYQLQLRLSRALLELPDCESIAGLALDLGFSNHSHLTAVFRSAFGMTPSDYRKSIISKDERRSRAQKAAKPAPAARNFR
jgi:AraC family transcriptional regulator